MQKIGWIALVWIFTWETFLRRSVFNWLLVFVEARKPAYIYARGRSAALQWFSSLQKNGPTNPSWSKAAVKAPKMSFKFPKVVWFGHAAPPSDRCDQMWSGRFAPSELTSELENRTENIHVGVLGEFLKLSRSLSLSPTVTVKRPLRSSQWANCQTIPSKY